MNLTIYVQNLKTKKGRYYELPYSEEKMINDLFGGCQDDYYDFCETEVVSSPFRVINLDGYSVYSLNNCQLYLDNMTKEQVETLDDFVDTLEISPHGAAFKAIEDFVVVKANTPEEIFECFIEKGLVEDKFVKFYRKNPDIFKRNPALGNKIFKMVRKGAKAFYFQTDFKITEITNLGDEMDFSVQYDEFA
jgi:hypothetical protein